MNKLILTVDDSPAIREMLAYVLKSAGHRVVEAEDGMDGLQKALANSFDLIITDQSMPKMDGIEATARIKTNRPGTIVIGISVNTGDDNGNAMRRAGAAVLLNKEAAVDDLYRTIQDLLKTNK